MDPTTLTSMGIDSANVDALFRSPRDNQPFVILYGVCSMPTPGVKDLPVIAYEATNSGGKRYVAYTTSQVELGDDARFRQLVPGAK